jgi:hypothetical protein
MSWRTGRQGGGYQVWTIFNCQWLMADCHVIKYPEGVELVMHTDPVSTGYRHHRINFVIWKPKIGGRFICKDAWRWGTRLFYFRPDIMPHRVSKMISGSRWVFSLGWCTHDS